MKTTINNTEVNLVEVLNKVMTSVSKVRKYEGTIGLYTKNINGDRFTFYISEAGWGYGENTLVGESKYMGGCAFSVSEIN